MDMTLLGETISASAAHQFFRGYWMPAGGNDGVAGVEVFQNSTGGAFTVHLESKSSDTDDTGASSIGSVSISAVTTTTPATYKFDVSSAQDLVRYVVESTKAGIVHMQFAQPLWHPN